VGAVCVDGQRGGVRLALVRCTAEIVVQTLGLAGCLPCRQDLDSLTVSIFSFSLESIVARCMAHLLSGETSSRPSGWFDASPGALVKENKN